MLAELEVACTRVSVTELRENTFYASITLQLNGREVEIDSRPSDALALAVRTGAPIFAAEDVISESAIEFEHEVEDTEEVVEKFKDFLDNVTPEDFAGGRGRRRASGRRGSAALAGPAARSASSRIRSTSASKPMPAASAAWGSRLVSVRPGIGLASSTYSSPSRVEHQVDAREAVAAEQPVGAQRSSWARSVTPSGSSAGQTNVGAADLVARLEVVEVLARAAPPRRPAAPRARRALEDRDGEVAPVDVALEQHLRS